MYFDGRSTRGGEDLSGRYCEGEDVGDMCWVMLTSGFCAVAN